MKRLLALICVLALLVGCTPAAPVQEDALTITATTYPVYLFALALTENIPNVKVERLDTGSVSCLHDYTLSVTDMKKIERADVLALSGAGLEEFMSDALAATHARVIDCSQGVELLPAAGHHGHDHSGEDHGHFDPHYWLDPVLAQTMVDNLYTGLSRAMPRQDGPLFANVQQILGQLQDTAEAVYSSIDMAVQEGIAFPGMVTFHDGFQYLAKACGTSVLSSIEEEAGSEASAKEMDRVIRLVRENNIPVIFTEFNGSQATAKAIAREAGCAVLSLSMLMDGQDPSPEDPSPITPYIDTLYSNVQTIVDGFAEQGGDQSL